MAFVVLITVVTVRIYKFRARNRIAVNKKGWLHKTKRVGNSMDVRVETLLALGFDFYQLFSFSDSDSLLQLLIYS